MKSDIYVDAKENVLPKWAKTFVVTPKVHAWLNYWGDYDKYSKTPNNNTLTDFKKGYQQAISDITDRLIEIDSKEGFTNVFNQGVESENLRIRALIRGKCGVLE